MMRIITGKARGVRLAAPEGEKTTRPTAERVKEAVFSMLQFEVEERQVLDLFAGSGQLGLEAVSRGAAHAVLVDRDRTAAELIKRNALKTRLAPDCDVYYAEHTEFLRTCRGKRRFDLVFLDPPYDSGLIPDTLRLLIQYRALSPNAMVICESREEDAVFAGDAALAACFAVRRAARYGAAFVTALTYLGEDAQ